MWLVFHADVQPQILSDAITAENKIQYCILKDM